MYTSMLIAVLVTIVRKWNQNKFSSRDEWIIKMAHICNAVFSAINKKKIDSSENNYVNQGDSVSERQKLYVHIHVRILDFKENR